MKTHRRTDVKADFEGRAEITWARGECARRYSCGRIRVDPFDDFRHISHVVSASQQDQFDRPAPRKPCPEGRGQGELYKNGNLPYREAPPGRAGRLHTSEGAFMYPEQRLTKRQSIRRERAGK
jgi:hypothetical protein